MFKVEHVVVLILAVFVLFFNPGKPIPTISPLAVDKVTSSKSKFVQLSRGRTHYVIHSSNSPVKCLRPIVLVHGFSMGLDIWGKTVKKLENHNCPIVTYDLYGRGVSDAVFPNDESLFVGQLAELLFAIQKDVVKQLSRVPEQFTIDLIGVSMGGVIVSLFTKTYPDIVNSLVLISPAGLPTPIPFTAKIGKLPIIGELMMPLVGVTTLKEHIVRGFKNREKAKSSIVSAAEGLVYQNENHPGFIFAILSTLRYFPLNDCTELFSTIGEIFQKKQKKILVVWGDADVTTPFENKDTLIKLLGGQVDFATCPNCAHADTLETSSCVETLAFGLSNYLIDSN